MSRIGLAVLLATPLARAEPGPWVSAELPAALAVSDTQAGLFRPGAMPAVGAYLGDGPLAFGLRLRAGVLRNGPGPGDNLADPGVGGLMTGGLAMRLRARGAWVEAVGGGGVTGSDPVPVVELGLGWSFAVGQVDVGPSARWLRVISNDPMDAFGSADLIVAGVDVAWGRPRRAPTRLAAVVAPPRPARPPEPPPPPRPPPVERDPERLVDRDASCAEVLDGCPLAEDVVVREDRIVLDERVLFDLGRSRVRSRGRAVIAEIARAWRSHPAWRRITIEGHTDVRGSDAFNQRLSERRAARARAALLRHGFEPDQVDAIGYGRSRPRSQGHDEAAHTRNRRVEFVIVRDVADRVTTSEVSP